MNRDELIKTCEFLEGLEYMRAQECLYNIKKINDSEFEINIHTSLDNKDIYEKLSRDIKQFLTKKLFDINIGLTN